MAGKENLESAEIGLGIVACLVVNALFPIFPPTRNARIDVVMASTDEMEF